MRKLSAETQALVIRALRHLPVKGLHGLPLHLRLHFVRVQTHPLQHLGHGELLTGGKIEAPAAVTPRGGAAVAAAHHQTDAVAVPVGIPAHTDLRNLAVRQFGLFAGLIFPKIRRIDGVQLIVDVGGVRAVAFQLRHMDGNVLHRFLSPHARNVLFQRVLVSDALLLDGLRHSAGGAPAAVGALVGSGALYKDSWYDLTNEAFRASWMEFARALVQGDILVSDLYSNTQVMTGETLAGLGSSAAILYYNDVVTYPDNTTEPTDLLLAPLPHAAGTATPLMPQAGVGLCAFKTTDQKAEAAAVFLRWLTEQQRNLEFAADTGYMPVSSAAFDAIADYPFEQQSYQRLYDVYNAMRIQNTPVSEPGIVGYHAKTKTFYDSLRQRQKDYPQRLAGGETLEALTAETWQLLCDNA